MNAEINERMWRAGQKGYDAYRIWSCTTSSSVSPRIVWTQRGYWERTYGGGFFTRWRFHRRVGRGLR